MFINIKIINKKLVNESYTTQTCHKCGEINKKVGNNNVYECVNPKSCGKFGRDINSAKLITMRGILAV